MSKISSHLPQHILFVFIDGMGLGQEHHDFNPLCQLKLPSFEVLAGNQQWTNEARSIGRADHVFKPIDACLSVSGLPQSGTGQATLFTGVNCAEAAGRHFGPYPHSTSKPIIAKQNVFSLVNEALPFHASPNAFANAYPKRFFDHAEARNRWTVTTLACIEGNVPIRTEKDLANQEALTAEITGKAWVEKLKINTSIISEQEAAKRLVDISNDHPFTLYEYYLTDKAGHKQNMDTAAAILQSLERFFEGILKHIDLTKTLLLITSDHGNIEDLSTKSHTFNPVPLIAYGQGASFFKNANSLLDITPAILETLRTLNSTSISAL